MIKKIYKLCFFFALILILGIHILNINNLYIFLGAINQNTILCGLYIILFFSILRGRVILTHILLILSMFLLLIIMIWNYSQSKQEIFIFTSPSKANTILIEDSKYTHFYLRKTNFIYELLQVDLAATSIHSFKDCNYSIRWLPNNQVNIKYLLFGSSCFDITFDLKDTNQLYEGTILSKEPI